MTDLLLLPDFCESTRLARQRASSERAATERAGARSRVRQAHAILAFVGLCRAVADFKPEPEPTIVLVPMPDPVLDRISRIQRENFLDYQITSAVLAMGRGLPFDTTLLKGLMAHV